MSFPNKAARQACWDARDRYWACLDANAESASPCSSLRELYEKGCPSQWVSTRLVGPRARRRQRLEERELGGGGSGGGVLLC